MPEPEDIGGLEWWPTTSGGYLSCDDEFEYGRVVIFDRDDDGWGMGFMFDDEDEKPVWCREMFDEPEDAAEAAWEFYLGQVCPLLGLTEAMVNFDDTVVKVERTMVRRGDFTVSVVLSSNAAGEEVSVVETLVNG